MLSLLLHFLLYRSLGSQCWGQPSRLSCCLWFWCNTLLSVFLCHILKYVVYIPCSLIQAIGTSVMNKVVRKLSNWDCCGLSIHTVVYWVLVQEDPLLSFWWRVWFEYDQIGLWGVCLRMLSDRRGLLGQQCYNLMWDLCIDQGSQPHVNDETQRATALFLRGCEGWQRWFGQEYVCMDL